MPHFPVAEIVKSLPGLVGIRLEDQPRFELVQQLGDVEIRRYVPAVHAQVTLGGSRKDAVDRAFDVLASYLFGGNDQQRTMQMAVPVYQTEGPEWTVAFFVSNDMVPSELPRPNDSRIELVRVPERLVASLRYAGNNTDERLRDAGARLVTELRQQSHYLKAGEVLLGPVRRAVHGAVFEAQRSAGRGHRDVGVLS